MYLPAFGRILNFPCHPASRGNVSVFASGRSDGSRFHLSLFSGAENVPTHSGGIAGNRLLGDFRCVHDEFGDSASPSIVVLTNAGDSREGVRRQLEEAADQSAQVLQGNVRPSQRYDFDGVALEARAD